MPWTDAGVVLTPYADRLADLRARIDAALAGHGHPPLDYDGTIEGALTEAIALLDYEREEGLLVAQDALSPETATAANLDRHGQRARIPRLTESRSRYTVRAVASGTIVYPRASIVTDPSQPSVRWQVVEDTTVTTSPTPVVIEALQPGPVALDSGSPTTLRATTPIGGLVSVTYDPSDGDPYALGRYAESDGAYRVRLRRLRSTDAGPTYPGIRAALLAGVPWVAAVSMRKLGAGLLEVTVVPGPVGSDQRAELVAALVEAAGAGTTLTGSDSETVTLPGGETAVVSWTPGSTQAVAVAAQIVVDPDADTDEVKEAAVAAIGELFADLDVGDPLHYWTVVREIVSVEGVIGIVTIGGVPQLTLNGGRADVTPLSTVLLVPSTITVTT